MPTPDISAQEQLMMELINRARLDPVGEAARHGISLNDGLASGTISSAPKAPLAIDIDLNEAAAGHSSWMLANNVFSHTGSGGSSPGDRMKVAGYSFSGSWSWGENLAWCGTTGTLDITQSIYEHHKDLFLSPGHRVTTMGDFREFGIAQKLGEFTESGVTYNASMVTQNFAKTGTEAFITGVAYNDADKDRFYDTGEGKSGIIIDWLGNSGGAIKTAVAGGYGVRIPTGLSGTADVAVTVGTVTMQASLGMTGTNVKLDVIDGRILASSTSLTLGSNAKDGLLLGLANTELTGNGAANMLEGNKGANVLNGGGGNDILKGGAGADKLIGGADADTLIGGAGSDDFIYVSASNSAPGARDVIYGFSKSYDDVDISRIDANASRSDNQAFALDTNGSFSAGEIRQKVTSSGLLIEFNTDTDSTPEMALLIQGLTSTLAATDFIL